MQLICIYGRKASQQLVQQKWRNLKAYFWESFSVPLPARSGDLLGRVNKVLNMTPKKAFEL